MSETKTEKAKGSPGETSKETKKGEFLNPFDPGVSYKDFLATVPKGVTVKEHCAEHLSEEQIAWLETEIKHYNNNKKAK